MRQISAGSTNLQQSAGSPFARQIDSAASIPTRRRAMSERT